MIHVEPGQIEQSRHPGRETDDMEGEDDAEKRRQSVDGHARTPNKSCKSRRISVAPAARRCAPSPCGAKPKHLMPAATAPVTPSALSSSTRQDCGERFSAAAAARNTSGAGFGRPPLAMTLAAEWVFPSTRSTRPVRENFTAIS